ncbi:hypothetical protein Dsin_009044 [Dipteronia sinensis]|uniref:Uncharacterized protein n=1 Tax=Dipteronia sinensis TaxID=43782 RepID=A0AAE0AR22_9ROSI|nr:hypothetical protein Dsin_009044 [Dipteronia sinensis]
MQPTPPMCSFNVLVAALVKNIMINGRCNCKIKKVDPALNFHVEMISKEIRLIIVIWLTTLKTHWTSLQPKLCRRSRSINLKSAQVRYKSPFCLALLASLSPRSIKFNVKMASEIKEITTRLEDITTPNDNFNLMENSVGRSYKLDIEDDLKHFLMSLTFTVEKKIKRQYLNCYGRMRLLMSDDKVSVISIL